MATSSLTKNIVLRDNKAIDTLISMLKSNKKDKFKPSKQELLKQRMKDIEAGERILTRIESRYKN